MEPQQTSDDVIPSTSRRTKAKEAPPDRRRACIKCRLRKMRCDGGQPACKPCIAFGRLCEYSADRAKSTGPRPAAILIAHLAELEEKLRQMLAGQPRQRTANSSAFHAASPLQSDTMTDPHPDLVVPTCKVSEIEFSPEDRDKIFTIFFQYQHRLPGSVDPSYFTQAIRAPQESLRPHPALLDGMVLIGIMLGQLTKQTHLFPQTLLDTDQFLLQIHRKLAISIEQADRLFDHLQALLLLCSWYFYNSRLQEAQYFSSLTFRLVVAYQLHQIDADVLREDLSDSSAPSFWDKTILGRPKSRRQLHSRILTFWYSYCCERMISLVTGLPLAGDDGLTITTLWPQPAEEFELEGALALRKFDTIQELFTGEIEQPCKDDKIMNPAQWMMLALLGRATQLSAITETLGPDDVSALDDVVHQVNVFANAVRVFDSTLWSLDKYLPPHQSIKSSPHGMAWCAALQARIGAFAVHLHLLRSIETVQKLLVPAADSLAGSPTNVTPETYAAFVKLVPSSRDSFPDMRFAFARKAIKLAYEVARQNVEDDPLGFASTMWLTHLPILCGFMLPSFLLAVIESIHDLEARIRALPTTEADELQTLKALLEDAETTFTQGMQVMCLLSRNMAVLRFQIERVEQARHLTLQT